IKYAELVATWRLDHPHGGDPEAIVFIDLKRGRPMSYPAMRRRIQIMAEKAGIEKRVHPHLFRKARVTHMLQAGYTETTIKKMVWSNLDTRVLKTYGVLADGDIDAELEEKAGVAKEIRKNMPDPDRPIVCPKCNHVNISSNEFCGKCMTPLTDEATDEMEQLIRDVIARPWVIKEAFERTHGKVLDGY
ncbi:MAG: site-specific integrase, partial [Methanoregulaceae archaeon]|nr:site-specific integrase [Methanoregulaceae archaeon]